MTRHIVPMLTDLYRKNPKRPVSRAELYAWQQLDGARHDGCYLDAKDYVTFKSDGATVYDPWLSEDAQAGLFGPDHNGDGAVDPFEHYGHDRMDDFIRRILFKKEGFDAAFLKAGDWIHYVGDGWNYGGEYEVVTLVSTYVEPSKCPDPDALCIVEFASNDMPMFVDVRNLKPAEWELL